MRTIMGRERQAGSPWARLDQANLHAKRPFYGHFLLLVHRHHKLERLLLNYMQGDPNGGLEPQLVDNMMQQIKESSSLQEIDGDPPVLLTAQELRLWLSRLLRSSLPGLTVLAYSEIPANKQIKVVSTAGQAARTATVTA